MLKLLKVSLYILLVLFLLVGLIVCSADPIAGSAGAGNPVIISMIAEGASADSAVFKNNKIINRKNKSINSQNFNSQKDSILRLIDGDNMPIDIDKVFISACRISFPKPSLSNATQDNKTFSDSNVIDGPFIFNILNGASIPSINFTLPNGDYENVKITITPGIGDSLKATIDSTFIDFEILLTGKFTYNDTIRNINIYIHCDTSAVFPAQNGKVTLLNEVFVELFIELDEREWLNDVYIRVCIKKGLVQFDTHGNLILKGNPSDTGPAACLARRIQSNIFNSGVFKRKSSLN